MPHPQSETALERVNWDDVRLLLHVARSGSFRAAADDVNMSPNTLRRRLSGLESELGHVLLARRANGVSLTREGIEVAGIAARMRGEAADLERMARQRRNGVSGDVKVAMVDNLGTCWVTHKLMNLTETYPEITMDLWWGTRLPNVSRHDVDISIELGRPVAPDVIAARVGFLHLELFASDEYIRLHGVPSSFGEIAQFHVVEQVSEHMPQLGEIVPNPGSRRFVAVRTITSTSHVYAIAHGAGIGLLPTFARNMTPSVRSINCDYHVSREIWMTYHPAARKMKHVRAAIGWLKDGFDPARHPWFRETYVSAHELEGSLPVGNILARSEDSEHDGSRH